MSAAALPETLRLSLPQQWRQFSQPRTMHAWYRERFGPLAPVRFLGQDHVFVLTAEGAREVFGIDPEAYAPFFKEGFIGAAGPASLWVMAGAAHRQERALFTPVVHANYFRRYGNTVRDITRFYLEAWRPGRTLRAMDTTLAISRDVIMRLVFGMEEGELLAEGRKILDALHRVGNALFVFVPWLQRRWFLPWTQFALAKDDFSEWLSRYLQARRARGEGTDDVIGHMFAARHADGSPMRDAEIRDELLTILQGGHQTTAGALAWALYELGRHPAVLEKLRTELESSGAVSDPALVVKLPYLTAVCNEAVRMHPVLAECGRVPTVPVEILGRTIPAGNPLVISIVTIHHDPSLYPEPDRFRPERFIERSYTSSEFLPFGGAHRRCLGAGLSEFETRIALAEMVLNWDFEAASLERDVRHDIAMGPRKGVPLRIMARRQPGPAVDYSTTRGDAVHA